MEDTKDNITRKQALEIISQQAEAYSSANKLEQGKILDSLQSILKRPRKSLIRTINSCIAKQAKQAKQAHHMSCIDKAAAIYSKNHPSTHIDRNSW